MTNDEAIYVLKNTALIGAAWIGDEKQFYDLLDAVKMAVEALKRETSDDAIDRQAAIRIASGYCHPANVAKELAKLPSVQPDIIACGDCKHYIPHDTRCGYWNHGVQPLMWCSHAERRWKE